MKTIAETLYRREELDDIICEIINEVTDKETKEFAIEYCNTLIDQINSSNIIRNKELWLTKLKNIKNSIELLNF